MVPICSDRYMFRQVYAPTGLCSDRSMLRQVTVQTGRCSDRSLFRQVAVQAGRCSDLKRSLDLQSNTRLCNMYGKQFFLIYYHVDPYVLVVLVLLTFVVLTFKTVNPTVFIDFFSGLQDLLRIHRRGGNECSVSIFLKY